MNVHPFPLSRHRRFRIRRRRTRWMLLVPLTLAAAGLAAGVALIALGSEKAKASTVPALLRLRIPSDPATLDPARATDDVSIAVISQVFDGLVTLDPSTGDPRPSIAASWEISRDGRTYTFHLRPGARFQNGREIEPADVVYSFERLLSPEIASDRRWVLSRIRGAGAFADGLSPRVAGLRAASRGAVEIDLDAAYGPFITLLAMEAASVLPREVYSDPNEAYLRAPVGAGPFRLSAWEPGRQITLVADVDHYGVPTALPGIVYKVIPSEAAALDAYLAGGLDVLDAIPEGRRAEMESTHASELRRGGRPAATFIGFNHARGPLKDNLALRQSLNHAVDRETLCRSILPGTDVPATGILPPGVAGYDAHARGYAYDPARASALLARAGYPRGAGLPELTLGYSTGGSSRAVCEKVRTDLAAIGVKVALRPFAAGALTQAILGDAEKGSDLDLFMMGWAAEYPDPDAFMTPALESSSTPMMGNFGRYANPRLDRVLDRARASSDPGERIRLYREAERLAVDDAAWLFLYVSGDDALVKPYVSGLVIPAFGQMLAPLQYVSIDPRRTAGM